MKFHQTLVAWLVGGVMVGFVVGLPNKVHALPDIQHPRLTGNEHGAEEFPMKAEVFKKKVTKRLQMLKKSLDAWIARKKIPPSKAEKIRAKFEQVSAQVWKVANEAMSDGVVTKEESDHVRKVARKAAGHR
jgi:hypothetical protein